MRTRIILLALAVLPAAAVAQASSIQPNCRADRKGDRLVTTVEYPNGYIVQAPWLVVDQRIAPAGPANVRVTAIADRVIEFDPGKQERVATPFPSAIEVVFEADTEANILPEAARVWCATVTRVRAARAAPRPTAFRVT